MQRITADDRITEVWMRVIEAKKIANLMERQQISQREMCRIIGWKSHSYFQKILRGEIKSVQSETAVKIATVLGVGIDDLFMPKVTTVKAQTDPRKDAA